MHGSLLQRMRALTERSGKAATHCANMLNSEGLYDDFIVEMKRTSSRLTADLNRKFSLVGEENLRLDAGERIGLLLFYRECLTNILRHSNATEVETQLTIEPNLLQLVVVDNGIGLGNTNQGDQPLSLKRRARILGASMDATQPETGGTKIHLRLRQDKRGWMRYFSIPRS